ncbi:MAG: ESPR domain-containing protein [Sutterella sp.]|nr:ESPR domain-containing protein [Sutterella sp.]
MNHIFRVIWNEALHLWQCVNELTQSHAKATQSN